MPDSLDTYIYALAFLVPGFILNSAISVFVPERKVEAQVLILRLLTLSAAHYALWFWLVFVLPNDWYKTYTAWAVAGWLAIVIVSPALIGLLFGYFQQRAVLYRLLRALGFTPLMSDASAWNYKLTRVTRPTNVIVTLDDGSEVAGLFWTKSFASVSQDGADLYLERCYQPDLRKKTWKSVPGSDGVYIAGQAIKHVRFFVTETE